MSRLRVLPLLLLLTGCGATLVDLKPVPSEGQDQTWAGGTPLLTASGPAADVTVAPAGELGAGRYPLEELIPLFLQVRNTGWGRFDVSEGSVVVTASDPGHPSGKQRARVLRGREMADRALSDASVSASIIGFLAISDLVVTTTAVVGARDSEQRADAFASSARNQELLAAHAESAADLLQRRLGVASRMLQRTTLEPGQEVRGLLLVERPKIPGCSLASGPLRCRLEVTVTAGPQDFVLAFDERSE